MIIEVLNGIALLALVMVIGGLLQIYFIIKEILK